MLIDLGLARLRNSRHLRWEPLALFVSPLIERSEQVSGTDSSEQIWDPRATTP